MCYSNRTVNLCVTLIEQSNIGVSVIIKPSYTTACVGYLSHMHIRDVATVVDSNQYWPLLQPHWPVATKICRHNASTCQWLHHKVINLILKYLHKWKWFTLITINTTKVSSYNKLQRPKIPLCIDHCSYRIEQKFDDGKVDEFDEWLAIHQSFSLQTFIS